jgi:antirestriction protein
MEGKQEYVCYVCEADLTEAVARARSETVEASRFMTRFGARDSQAWKVTVTCPNNHANIFEGGG